VTNTDPGPEISVVVPAYLGARTIADCLASIQQAVRGRSAEVIVVESSGDGTAAIVRERFPDVRVIQSSSRLTAGGARNRGTAESRGKIVFFTDQDCIVPPDWISRIERHLGLAGVGAAGGSVGIKNLSSLSGCAMYFLEFLYHFPGRGRAPRDDNFMVGCNSAYRRELLQQVSFPDQTLGEDVLFSERIRQAGFGIVYDPDVEVEHHNREGWREFFSYNGKMGRSAAAYHLVLQRRWARPFLRVPALTFLAPAAILPSIGVRLARSRWSYLFRFLALTPMCLAGNLVWARAFRREVLDSRRRGQAAE
jgi:GT2 family glycosyltransferase